MQILVRTVHTVRLFCACCCATTGALVGACSNCGFPQLPFLWGRAMLGSTMDTCSASSRVAFGRIFHDFLHEGVDSAPELDSRPGRHVVDNGSGMFLTGFAGLTHLALCSHDCRQFADRCFSCSRVALGNLYIIFHEPPVFSAFFQILRELIFWGPRALTVVSARGPGMPESPGVYSQVTRHRVFAN